MTPLPSGEQFVIRSGEQEATIVEVGGGLRTYAVGDRDVIQPYAADAMCDGAHGAPLIPWPNRLADGRYSFDGHDQQLALSEPDKHNAIHGLTRWLAWHAVERADDRVVMGLRLHPSKGYPFTLDLRISYRFDDHGLAVTTTATNVGPIACPYGSGQHPYLSPGPGAVDADAVDAGSLDRCRLVVDADTRILTDPARQLPTGREPVAGGAHDFRSSRPLGGLAIDDPFTDLRRDGDGRAWVRLAGPDGRTVELWVDAGYPVLQLYTGDRHGLAAEPMTCPPNGFATGHGLIRLEPGATTTATWGVGLSRRR